MPYDRLRACPEHIRFAQCKLREWGERDFGLLPTEQPLVVSLSNQAAVNINERLRMSGIELTYCIADSCN